MVVVSRLAIKPLDKAPVGNNRKRNKKQKKVKL